MADAAALLGISEDTVRKEIRANHLRHVVLAERALRIPRWAIESRLAGSEPAIRANPDEGVSPSLPPTNNKTVPDASAATSLRLL